MNTETPSRQKGRNRGLHVPPCMLSDQSDLQPATRNMHSLFTQPWRPGGLAFIFFFNQRSNAHRWTPLRTRAHRNTQFGKTNPRPRALSFSWRRQRITIPPMRKYFPEIDPFTAAAKDHELVPVYRQLLGDHLTPVTAFEVLGRDDHAFLLESVVGGERIARYSFIATSPTLVYQCFEGATAVIAGGNLKEGESADPLHDLEVLLPKRRYFHNPKLPNFTGGLVGYAGYDTIRYYEGEKLTNPPKDDRRLPDLLFALYNEMVIFDHVDKTIKVVANADLTRHPNVEVAYKDACHRIDELVQRLSQPPVSKLGEIDPTQPLTLKFASNLSREQYEEAVRKGKGIHQGRRYFSVRAEPAIARAERSQSV